MEAEAEEVQVVDEKEEAAAHALPAADAAGDGTIGAKQDGWEHAVARRIANISGGDPPWCRGPDPCMFVLGPPRSTAACATP